MFDGDKYVTALRALYPETGSDLLQNSVNEHQFRHAKLLAIRQKGSFAFETNFSANDPTSSLNEFRAAGYKCHLIFMGMDTVEECIQRVSLRVKAGGHKVTEESIEYNFLHGCKNLYTYFRLFDSVTLFDSSIAENTPTKIPEKVLGWRNGKIRLYKSTYPD